MEDLDFPDIQVHGSISLTVNFDFIRRYIEKIGGTAITLENSATEFQVACFISKGETNLSHTKMNFANSLQGMSPQDAIHLCYQNDEPRDDFNSLDELIGLLNTVSWDPSLFYDLYEPLLTYIEDEEEGINLEQEITIIENLPKVYEYFFKLERDQDLPFAIASVYYALDLFDKALYFYKLSIESFGENAENLFNLAICYQMLEQYDTSKLYANKSIELDPDYTPSLELLEEL